MNKFERTEAPVCLTEAANESHCTWTQFSSRKCYKETRAALLKISDDTCAFCAGGFAQSRETIEHFRPKSGTHQRPDLTLDWHNLFPCCDACQSAKRDKWNNNLLKPDESDYDPCTYFVLNSDGELAPLNVIDPGTDRAKITIDLYGLNRAPLKKERRKIIQMWKNNKAQTHSQHSESDYRFIKELLA